MDNILDEFQCSICCQILEDPVVHKICNKKFCAGCLNTLLCQSQLSPCPNCRQNIFKEDLKLDLDTENKIKTTQHQCLCGKQVNYQELNQHLDTCEVVKGSFKPSLVRPKEKVVNRWTFKCPACDLNNLERKNFVEHFCKTHPRFRGVCPICAVMPWGDPNYISSNLSGHLKTRHQMDYDTLTDYSMNDDEILQKVLEESMKKF